MRIEETKRNSNPGKIRLRRSSFAFCPSCDKAVDLLTFDAAAEAFNTDVQDIGYLARHGSLHRVHNRAGKVMICSMSLFDCFEMRRTRLLDSHFIEDCLLSSGHDA